jgi:large subunit ribosomal protein L1
MTKISKRRKVIKNLIEPGKLYSIEEAVETLKKVPKSKFDETVEMCLNLGIDASKSEQAVRGATVLPNGTGRTARVAVFAQNEKADEAKAAGAEIVGFEDLAENIKKGELDFDVLIATPDAMKIVGNLGQILGPKGLMPNPKVGTVSVNVAEAVRNAKMGQVRYRTEKNGIIHCSIGKLSFAADAIKQNLEALLIDIKKAKPAATKGTYLKKLVISSTMGPGLAVDFSSLKI